MSIEESNITKQIMLRACLSGSRLFRNNVGKFTTRSGATVMCGLHKGSSDLIGWTTRTITPDMVGRDIAIFTSIEVKTAAGRMRPEQSRWIDQVKKSGGIAFVARSDDDCRALNG